MSEESSKKAVRIGPKKKLPAKLSRESGIPQHNKMGIEIRVIKSCTCIKVSMEWAQVRTVLYNCMNVSIAKKRLNMWFYLIIKTIVLSIENKL